MTEASKSFDNYLLEQLKDPVFRKEYLKEALIDEDPRLFLHALHLAIKASDKTMKELAEISGVKREHLHRALSLTGNPSWSIVYQILQGLGYDLSIKKRST